MLPIDGGLKMTRILTAIVMSTLATSAALAQVGPVGPRDEVVCNGKVAGHDPDSNVRLQMRRDCGSEGY